MLVLLGSSQSLDITRNMLVYDFLIMTMEKLVIELWLFWIYWSLFFGRVQTLKLNDHIYLKSHNFVTLDVHRMRGMVYDLLYDRLRPIKIVITPKLWCTKIIYLPHQQFRTDGMPTCQMCLHVYIELDLIKPSTHCHVGHINCWPWSPTKSHSNDIWDTHWLLTI